MDCYSQLLSMQEHINSESGFSYAKLDELKESNQLDDMIKSYNIDFLLKQELDSFIQLLDNNNYYHEYLRKIYLNESNLVKVFNGFGYVLSLYFNNKEAYRVFPLFFKECLNHYNINKFNEMSLDELDEYLSTRMDLRKFFDLNSNRNLITVNCRTPELFTDYSKYINNFTNKSTINVYDQNEFFVYSEYDAYQRELRSIANFNISNPKEFVRWVSRCHGDGYGFDVLGYDIKRNREKLIEVKSSLVNKYELTENEYHVMKETIDKEFCDYYVYKYYYDKIANAIIYNFLKYNKSNDTFVDINSSEFYEIDTYFYDDKGAQKLSARLINEGVPKKVLVKGGI